MNAHANTSLEVGVRLQPLYLRKNVRNGVKSAPLISCRQRHELLLHRIKFDYREKRLKEQPTYTW